jgi:hypothetical protein
MLVFVVIAVAGVFFLVVSAFLGGDHDIASHEVSFEHGWDQGADHGADAGGGPSPYSLRVIAIFLTATGSIGAICRYYDFSYLLSACLGVVGGFIIGVLGWQILCVFYKQQASSTVTDEDLLKANLAEVKTAIPASGVGQICVVVKGQRRYLSARSQGGTPIEEGAAVKIVGCPGGDAVLVQKT